MAVMELEVALTVLMILYGCSIGFGFLASVPMVLHVYPQSECLLFSGQYGDKLHYGHWATCDIVAYLFLFVIAGAMFLLFKTWRERKNYLAHAVTADKFEDQQIPKSIVTWHSVIFTLGAILTIMTTAGYISACNNLHLGVSSNVQQKLNADPFDTRGEEIRTRYEDDYKFHRYTNRYGNAFGSEFYTIRITCRSILTDPEIHQKLHDSHYETQSRYYGYWYGTDLFAYDSQAEATKTNALVEASMAGCWLCLACWIGGLILMILQKYVIKRQRKEFDRMSAQQSMMGSLYKENQSVAAMSRREGSMYSGKGSQFVRGGSQRGSDRSVKSSARRDVDDIILSNVLSSSQHHLAAANQPMSSYGRKDIDDMVINQHLQQFQPPVGVVPMMTNGYGVELPSHSSSWETGYGSGHDNLGTNFQLPVAAGVQRTRYNPESGATYLQRDEVETEIF